MAFGIYVHIPYCLQRCTYCDFATYEQSKIMPPADYFALLKRELELKAHLFKTRHLDTVYFGGGTPSLVPADLILTFMRELEKAGFTTGPKTEITIEINPATLDSGKMEQYFAAGINRFSVGAQTFDDRLLKMVHREHNAKQTFETLEFLNRYNVNYSFDILFGLPTQTLEGLQKDMQIALQMGASHISPYCLTVPEGHPLSKGRPPEEEQLDMFSCIDEGLTKDGFVRYEISNYSRPGFESRHNLLYWTDQEYWGMGLSAHSYLPDYNWGLRYWNPNNIQNYANLIAESHAIELNPAANLPADHFEILEKNQSLTDMCHTSLRLMRGLQMSELTAKFGESIAQLVLIKLQTLEGQGLVSELNGGWCLSPRGILISNKVFEELTFLANDLPTH